MNDEPRPAETSDEGGMPRWLKVSGIVVLLLALLVVVVMLVGGGEHGPGRHFGQGASTASTHALCVEFR